MKFFSRFRFLGLFFFYVCGSCLSASVVKVRKGDREFYSEVAAREPRTGKALFASLKGIRFNVMENPKLVPSIPVGHIIAVREALEKLFIAGDLLPEVLKMGVQQRRIGEQLVYSIYTVVENMLYGKRLLGFRKQKPMTTYREAYEAGVRVEHLAMIEKGIRDSRMISKRCMNNRFFSEVFTQLTGFRYVQQWSLRKDHSYRGSDELGLPYADYPSWAEYWVAREAERVDVLLSNSMRYYIISYAFERGFKRVYNKLCAIDDIVLRSYLSSGKYVCQDTTLLGRDIKHAIKLLDSIHISETGLSSSFCKKRAWMGSVHYYMYKTKGIYEKAYFFSFYTLLTYIKRIPYREVMEEGWTKAQFLSMEKNVGLHAVSMYKLHGEEHREIFLALACLLGVYGTSKLNKLLKGEGY